MKITLLIGVAALGLSGPAIAQDTPPPPPNDMSAAQMPQSSMESVPDPSTDPDAGMAADQAPPAPPAPPVSDSPPATRITVGGNMTPPPPPPKDYPVCSRTVRDECINPGEAKRARHRK